jgi:hypothetical protein
MFDTLKLIVLASDLSDTQVIPPRGMRVVFNTCNMHREAAVYTDPPPPPWISSCGRILHGDPRLRIKSRVAVISTCAAYSEFQRLHLLTGSQNYRFQFPTENW